MKILKPEKGVVQIGCGDHFQNCCDRNFDSGDWTNFAEQRKRRHLHFGDAGRRCDCAFYGAFNDWRFVHNNQNNVQSFSLPFSVTKSEIIKIKNIKKTKIK